MPDDKLTDKQKKFALLYVELNNASEAYRQAYSTENMSNEDVWNEAYRLKNNPDVAPRIAELRSRVAERAEISIDRIATELAKIGFANMSDFIGRNEDGSPTVNLPEDPNALAIVSEVTVDRVKSRENDDNTYTDRIKFKLHDKLSALDKLGKHLGMFNDKLEVTGKDGKDLVPEREPRDIARAIVAVLNQAKVKEAEK